jgi:hypothetical protein
MLWISRQLLTQLVDGANKIPKFQKISIKTSLKYLFEF